MQHFFRIFFLMCSISLQAQQTQYSFKENLGQWESNIDYKLEYSDHTIFIEKDPIWTFVLTDEEKYELYHDNDNPSENDEIMDYFAYKIHFLNGDFSNKTVGEKSSSYSNYFIGNDRNKHKSYVYAYQSITYTDVWPQIDLIIYTNQNHQFKYDFILKKGANPSDIQLKYEGPECLTIENGELIINGSFSLLKEQLPITYIKSTKQQIPCSYSLNKNIITFNLNTQNITETIVIDPILVASTASGSTSTNFGHTAGYDKDGNIYTGGYSFGTGYPTNSGSYQQNFPNSNCTAINKLNPTGSNLIYSTYLGGTNGKGYPFSLACTTNNKLVILGSSLSSDYPTTINAVQSTHGGLQDITVSILSEDGGSLLGSTYLGGSKSDGFTSIGSAIKIADHDNLKGTVNVSNNEIVCVATIGSNDIPNLDYSDSTMTGTLSTTDAIVFRMDSTLSTLLGHKIIGGTNHERGYGLTTDSDNNVYICGATLSYDLQTTTNVYQEQNLSGSNNCAGFITKLTPNLDSILLSSYVSTPNSILSGKRGNSNYFISLDNDENIFVYGLDDDQNMPSVGNGYNFGDGSVYIAKFDTNMQTLLSTNRMGNASSIIIPGGSTNIGELGAFKVDDCNRILFSVYRNNSFQTTPDNIFQNGGIFIGVLSPGGQNLSFGTYYTGNHADGGTSQFSDDGTIYHALCHSGLSFNCLSNAYSQNITTLWDTKVFKIDPELEPIDIELTNIWPNMEFCIGSSHEFGANTSGAGSNDITWYLNDEKIDSNTLSHNVTFNTPGKHIIKIVGESSCFQFDEDTVHVNIYDINPEFISDTIHCVDGVLQFTDQSILPTFHQSTISDWLWDFGDGQQSTLQNPTHSYSSAGQYDISLTIFTVDSCESTINKPLHIEIFDLEPSFDFDSIVCDKNEVNFTPLNTIPEHIPLEIDSYLWDFGDGQESTLQNPSHIYSDTGQYNVTLHITLDNGCSYSTTNPSVITVKLLTIDMMLLTDSIWYPFDFPAEAYTLNTGFDSLQWYLDYEPVSNEEQIEFYLGTTDEVQYIDLTLKGWQGNCEATITKQIKLTNYEDFNIPNAFTPNGDGINDVFKPIGRQVENAEYFEFKIHNRWGEQVYFSNDNEAGWNGINKRGKKVSAGVYVWNLELQSKISGRQSYNGWVKLIK